MIQCGGDGELKEHGCQVGLLVICVILPTVLFVKNYFVNFFCNIMPHHWIS